MPEAALRWSDVLERHHSALVDDLSARLDSEVREAVSKAVADEQSRFSSQLTVAGHEARRAQSEWLNQVLRRLRGLHRSDEIFTLVGESCGGFSQRAVVLVFDNHQARVVAVRGIAARDLAFDFQTASAIVSAIETCDPVVAVSSAEQISGPLAEAFAAGGSDGGELIAADRGNARAYLFPIAVRHTVAAMLIAEGAVDSASIELLCGAAAMRLESVMPAPATLAPEAGGPEVPAGGPAERKSWDELTADDQKLHLQAQRVARVRIAGMRLDLEDMLHRGIAERNIYGALQSSIGEARQDFLRNFLSKSPTMVDYLHLEIMRTLAHDDDSLLGPDYPGPMV